MAQRKKRSRPPASRGRGGLIRVRDDPCPDARAAQRRHPSAKYQHDGSIWGRRRVLLLNSTYEPLTALPMRRAVIMLMCGKANVVHDDPRGPIIHSATRSIVVPSVIRLQSYVRVPVPGPHPDDAERR